jgi:SAM-dependent methyltransferase
LLELAGYRDEQPEFALFDYGCGLGRLAYAFTNYFGADASRRYIGYEVVPAAYEFLKDAYIEYQNASFFTDRIAVEESYVELQRSEVDASPRVSFRSTDLAGRVGTPIDLQFSHSVFTHMPRSSIVFALESFAKVMRRGGVCVNSWLVVDQFAKASLAAGLADRSLPHVVDGYHTYSLDNPLLCSAYPLATIREIYAEAGHAIEAIKFGTWSGRAPDQMLSYQDIIVSRPLGSSAAGDGRLDTP